MAGDEMSMVCLDSISEIRAVHKMLFNRKFDGPEDEYFGSPFIASVQHKLVDALAAAESGRRAGSWAAWRNAGAHPQILEKIRRHLTGLGSWWADAPTAKREAYVRDLLARSWSIRNCWAS